MKTNLFLIIILTLSVIGCQRVNNNAAQSTISATKRICKQVRNMSEDKNTESVTINDTASKKINTNGASVYDNVKTGTDTIKAETSEKSSDSVRFCVHKRWRVCRR